MQRQKVESSFIEEIGHDPFTSVMEILFSNGEVYQYLDVPYTEYEAFMMAQSKGRWFHRFVTPRYKMEKVMREYED
jgi:lysyl-tRNA synthetase class 2